MFYTALVHSFNQPMILTSQPSSFISESEFIGNLFLLVQQNSYGPYGML
jgi:hypothetical protein